MPSLLENIARLFRPAPYPKDSNIEPAQITRSKVLVIVYDPAMDAAGTKLSKYMKWKDTSELLTGFMADVQEVTKGMVRYEITERIDVNEFPAKTDGFRYTPQTYLDVWNRTLERWHAGCTRPAGLSSR